MVLDNTVQTYIDKLKKKFYQDGKNQKDGVQPYKEMISVVEVIINGRKYYYTKQKDFMNIRLTRLKFLKDTLLSFADETQIVQKYNVYKGFAKELVNTSEQMDGITGNLNATLSGLMYKIRMYNREYDEISYRLVEIDKLLDFYKESEETLSQLKALM